MRKRLLMMAFAALSVASSFAYEVGEYVYNSTQRFKIEGANLVTNGNFSDGLTGWVSDAEGNAPNGDVWSVEEGAGPNGEYAIKSLAATADAAFCKAWDLEASKNYVVSIDVKFATATNTGIGTASNCIDFFLNTDGSFTKAASTEEAPVINIASSIYCPAEEWKTLVFFIENVGEGQSLVMRLEKLATDAMFTNIEVHEATEVYDVRIAQRQIAFAKQLMEDANFNTAEAADKKQELAEAIEVIEGMIETGEMDSEDQAETMMGESGFGGKLDEFLSVTSQNLKTESYFKYVTDLTAFPKYNRGSIGDQQVIGGFKFRGGNWLHGAGAAELAKQIQGDYANDAGSVALYNENLPSGKYYISVEVRNANCDKNYALTFNLEKQAKLFIGSNELDCGTISGDEWKRLYFVGELKEGETFEAGVWWEGHTAGSRFEARNFEVRTFGEDLEAKVEHALAWTAFKTQWEAATSRRTTINGMIGNKDYPWEQAQLTEALTKWDPYYNAIVEKGWVTSEGEDAGIATTDELNDWALYQGVEAYATDEEGNPTETRLEYQLVRGYDAAINAVKAENKPISDLAATIKEAITTRDDDMNALGDKNSYQTVIDAAQVVYDDIYANTNDEKHEADTIRINEQMKALADAKEKFLASAKLEPFIDVDFSQGAVEDTEGDAGYILKGNKGQVEISAFSTVNNTGGDFNFTLGHGEELTDVLRLGNGTATVNFAEADYPGEDDVIRVNFNLWPGRLSKGYVFFDLRNAENQRVAGVRWSPYDGTVGYNDFNNESNTGMPVSTDYIPGVTNGNVENYTKGTKSNITLIIDFKAQSVQGIVDGKKYAYGEILPLKTDATDTKVVKFAFGSNYNYAEARRCWFDDLKIYKYASTAEGPIVVGIKGDVNGDGKIDVEDVVGIVNYILGEPAQGFLEAYADVTGDGKIDVDDVVAVVNIILEGSDAAAAPQLMNILLQNGFKF